MSSIISSGPVVIMLGMHRSGTSSLAGSLEQAGLYLGRVNRKANYNAKGNHENSKIVEFHDAILAANCGGWGAPPSEVNWTSENAAQRDAIIATYPVGRIWGFKDPRTLLTLEGWIEVLPSVRLVGTFRHPLAVAHSLENRNGIPHEKCMALWTRYNRLLLRYQHRFGIDLVCFDWPTDYYERKLAELAENLGLTVPKSGFDFFETGLRTNHVSEKAVLPAPVAELYQSLLNCVSRTGAGE